METLRPEQLSDLRAFYGSLLTPPPKISVVEWVEKNVRVPAGGSDTAVGGFRFDRVPYAREVLECYADRSIRGLSIVFGTQCIKTTIMRLGAMYRIVNDPMPCVWVLPNEKPFANSFSKVRWIPWLSETPATAALIPRSKTGGIDKQRFAFLEQLFPGMPINFVGSNSSANLSSRSAGLIQMDEIDKFGRETNFEPGALQNVEERAKNVFFHLIVKSSTPTVETHGIWREFQYTDQRYFYVPCPRCERLIVLRFRVKSEQHGDCGVRWWRQSPLEVKKDGRWDLDAVARACHYKCQECGVEILDIERHGMIQSDLAKWKPHHPDARAGQRGYHLSSLYSLVSHDCKLPNIAAKWCEKAGDPSERHKMINATFAEPWNTGKGFDDEAITLTNYDPTAKTSPPTDDEITIGTVDFQLNHFWVVFRRWKRPTTEHPLGQSWIILADRIDTEEEIAELQGIHQIAPEHMRLDVAGRFNAAGQIILRRRWRGLHGSDRKHYPHRMANGLSIQRIYSEIQWRDAHHGTTRQSRGTENFYPFAYWCKDPVRDLVAGLRVQEPAIWHVHSNVHKKYTEHLNAHVKLTKVNAKTGEPEDFWKEMKTEDHLLDCECMNAVTAVELGFAVLLDRTPHATQAELAIAR